MFSNNGKISNHQAVRLLIMDLFTGACLFLPMALPKVSGSGGILACFLGLLWTWLEGMILSAVMFNGEHTKFIWGKEKSKILFRWILGLRCLATYIFLMGLFVQVLSDTFLYTMSKWLIIAGMTLVLFYSETKGIEVRARLSEIMFYLVLIPIVFIGLFSLPEADWSNLWLVDDVTWRGILWGTIITWVLMAPLEWILYIEAEIIQRKPKNIFRWAIGIGGGLTLFLYALCQAVLGVNGMSGEYWPTVKLMQIIKIPGGFLSRQDGLMLSFWIFAMYISLSGALNHAGVLLNRKLFEQRNHSKKCIKRPNIVLLAAGTITAYFTGMNREFLNMYFYGMIISGIIVLWILPCIYVFIKKRGKKKLVCILMGILCMGSMTGCGDIVELENRAFVMAIGIDGGEKANYRFTFAFPDMAEITGNGSGEKAEPVEIEADCLRDAEELFNYSSEKMMDYGQVKVIVLGETLTADSELSGMLVEEIKNMPEVARTVLMCQSKSSANEIIQMDENINGSVGLYLENLINNHKKEVIFNDFIIQRFGTVLPVIGIQGDKITLCSETFFCLE